MHATLSAFQFLFLVFHIHIHQIHCYCSYRSYLQGSSPKKKYFLDFWTLEKGSIGYSETFVQNYHSTLRKIPEEHRALFCFDL